VVTEGSESGRVMAGGETSTERIVIFTDAVFAVIITVMVLELKLQPKHSSRLCFLFGPPD